MKTILCNDILNIIYRNLHELYILDIHRELSLRRLMKEYHNPSFYTMDDFIWNEMEPIIIFNYKNKLYKTNGIHCIVQDMINDGLNSGTFYNYIKNNLIMCTRKDRYTINDMKKVLLLLDKN